MNDEHWEAFGGLLGVVVLVLLVGRLMGLVYVSGWLLAGLGGAALIALLGLSPLMALLALVVLVPLSPFLLVGRIRDAVGPFLQRHLGRHLDRVLDWVEAMAGLR